MNSKLNIIKRLRWFACLGVLAVLGLGTVGHLFPVTPYSWYAVGGFAVSNILLMLFEKKIDEKWTDTAVLFFVLLDLAYLTLLLLLNGGAHNPFAILFIAICSAAAMTLPRFYLLVVNLFCLVCLAVVYAGLGMPLPAHDMHEYAYHLQGMWVANSLAVLVISFWINHLKTQNEMISKQSQETQKILFHLERVDSMGRILASTAHQLNTPLATLQLGVSELANKVHPLTDAEKSQWLVDLQQALTQISTILGELKQSQKISDKLGGEVNLYEYINTLTKRWAETRGVTINMHVPDKSLQLTHLNLDEFGAALAAILENAFDARKANTALVLDICVHKSDAGIEIQVRDNGVGMDGITLSRATEPLFTTKRSGTGLGLYFCHQLAKKLDGVLDVQSWAGQGTQVTFKLGTNYFK